MPTQATGKYTDLYDAIRLMKLYDLLVFTFQPEWKVMSIRSRISDIQAEKGFDLHVWFRLNRVFVARCA